MSSEAVGDSGQGRWSACGESLNAASSAVLNAQKCDSAAPSSMQSHRNMGDKAGIARLQVPENLAAVEAGPSADSATPRSAWGSPFPILNVLEPSTGRWTNAFDITLTFEW